MFSVAANVLFSLAVIHMFFFMLSVAVMHVVFSSIHVLDYVCVAICASSKSRNA